MSHRKIFISYSHDSPEHRDKVNSLSERLRKDGFETILDQHVNGTPDKGWPRWMMDGLAAAHHVLIVCTETYYRRFRGHEEPGKGKGVDWEGALITQEIYGDRSNTVKFVPIFLGTAVHEHIPDPLRSATHYELDSDAAYEALHDFLHGQAGVEPGPLGAPRIKQRTISAPLTFATPSPGGSIAKFANLPGGYIDRLFLGRDEFLDTIRRSLLGTTHATAITQKTAATGISGLGGIGKTHAAVEYANRHRQDYSALLFASADSPERLQTSLANLCDVLRLDQNGTLPQKESARVNATLDWLAANSGWLLILDNVDDEPAALAITKLIGYFTKGHVLITSRLHGWSDQVKNIDIEVLSDANAANLILQLTADRRRLADDDEAQALQLAKLLEGLPLAIQQAAGFINERTLTLSDYHARYLRESESLLEWFSDLAIPYERSDKLAPRPVLITWKTSFDHLTDEERFWFLVFSHFSADPIPEFLLEPQENATPEQRALLANATDAIARAEKFCLLTRSRTDPAFKLHRLVQHVTLLQAREEARRDAIEMAIELVFLNGPGDPIDVRNWAKWNPLESHARSISEHAPEEPAPEKLSWLLNCLGLLSKNKAVFAEAEGYYRRALRTDKANLGDDHPRVAVRISNLATLLRATNRLREAEPLSREALRINQAAFGTDHPMVAVCLNNLARLLHDTNRLDEAEGLMLNAVSIGRTVFGNDHPTVARYLNNLAGILQDSNRLPAAEPLLRESLRIDQAAFGNDHPNVALDLSNLARLLQAIDRCDEAEPLMQEALRIDKAAFGDDHPNVATGLNNLAHLLRTTHRLHEAEPLMREALRIDEAAFGNDHPKVAIRLNNLGGLLQDTNRLTEAEPLMREALRILHASLGSEHPQSKIFEKNLDRLLSQMAASTEARGMGSGLAR